MKKPGDSAEEARPANPGNVITTSKMPGRSHPPGVWRLLAPACVTWAMAAGVVGHPGSGFWVVVGASSIGLGLYVLKVWSQRRPTPWLGPHAATLSLAWRLIAITCALLVLVGARIEAQEYVRGSPDISEASDESRAISLNVRVASFPKSRETPFGESTWVRAEAVSQRGSIPVLLWLNIDHPDAADDAEDLDDISAWGPGTELSIRGVPERLDPGSADAFAFTVQNLEQNDRSVVAESLSSIPAQLRTTLTRAAAGIEGAELVPGFAVGDTSLVSDQLDTRMKETSLTHLTAVSGANCALVIAAVIAVASRLGAGRRLRIVLAAGGLAGFVAVVGPDASVQRAAVMAGVILVSGFGGKRHIALPALGVAVICLLVLNPWQSLQPGFALSVAATLGILLLVPATDRGLSVHLKLPQVIRLPIAVALAAQVSCGPLLLLLQPGIPAVGVLANVLAGPAAPLGTGIGLIALLLLPSLPSAGMLCVQVASIPTRWVEAVAEVTAGLPGARWHWPGGWAGALLLAACELALLIAWLIATGRLSLPKGTRALKRGPWQATAVQPRLTRWAISVLVSGAVGVFLSVVVVTPVAERAGVPRDWAVVACDVGQGDALLLRDPRQPDRVMLVDTGNDDELLKTCLRTFGVQKITLLVLSHDDADHVGALPAVVDQVEGALIAAPSASDEPVRDVVAQLEVAGVPTEVGAAGMAGTFAEAKLPGATATSTSALRWEMLSPAPGFFAEDTNAASLVMKVETAGFTTLLLGDTGAAEQLPLMALGDDLVSDIVKVAHHGSRDQHFGLYAAIRAKIALVSVGSNNGYGHPTAQTLLAVESGGADSVRTDEQGSIALRVSHGELSVWVTGATSTQQ